MFRNYFTVAFRNLKRNKIFSLINIMGLSLGISATLVIYLIVHHEFGFDKFQKDRDRIYRVVSEMHFPDQTLKLSGVSVPLIPAVANQVTGIELAVPFIQYSPSTITIPSTNEVYKNQPRLLFADEHYFNLIPYKWLRGNPSLLREPFNVVLTESRAKLYFGSAVNAIGKIIAYNGDVKTTVIGVVKDLNEITDFRFGEFISYNTIPARKDLRGNFSWDTWPSINSASQFFVKLAPGVSTTSIEKQITAIRKKNTKPEFAPIDHYLQPLTGLHFDPEYDNFNQHKGSKPTLFGLLLVAGFLLLLGCINFINLTTAQAAQRAREIGIRKTVGGSRRQLMIQFLSETFFLSVLACLLSLILIPWLLNLFADFIPPDIQFSLMADPHMLLFMGILIIAVTIASGFYPSMILSGYKPVLVMKNQAYANTSKTRKAWLRKSLTVSQFVIAQFFVIVTMIVSHQIKYSLSKDMGFRKDAIITMDRPFNNPEKGETLLNKLRQIPGVEEAVLAGSPPASMGTSFGTIKYTSYKGERETSVEVKNADSAYFSLYKMKLLAGRYPLKDSMKASEVLINNNYANFLGFTNPADAIGIVLDRGQGKVTVTGVLADFNFRSFHWSILPLIYTNIEANNGKYHVALQTGGKSDWSKTIDKIQSAYKQIYPDATFEYNFLDQTIASFYETEKNTSRLLGWSMGLCIFISCLGLLGLVVYTTNQRAKEIGVRKVLGASVASIVSLLSKDFLQLVLLAFIIATPLAWWAGYKWLEDFQFRDRISVTLFLLSGGGMMAIALLTLSIRIIRAAMMNPVKSLKTE